MSHCYTISFRNIIASDYSYLLQLYESTRVDIKLYGGHLSREQQMTLIKSQFELQDTHYKKFNPNADFLIIQNNGEDIGRIYKDELESEVRVIEFTLDEKVRSKGIGSSLILLMQTTNLLFFMLQVRVVNSNFTKN